MNITINQLSENLREITVLLNAEEVKPEIEEIFKKESQKLQIPGFRKGKAPMSMVKKLYGETIEYRATEKISEKKFWEAVESEKINPVSIPKLTDIDYSAEKGLTFKAEFEVIPNIEPKEYKNLDFQKVIFEVTDEMLEKEFTEMLKKKATYEDADIIDSTNYVIEVEIKRIDEHASESEHENSQPMKIDLSSNVNPEIVTNSNGKKVGDVFEFSFVDEHKHGEEVHKVEYKYENKIKSIKKIVLPVLTDEFIKEETKDKYSSVDEYKKFLKDTYEHYNKSQSEEILLNSILSKISENNPFEVPQGYIDIMYKRLNDYEKENAKRNKKHYDEQLSKEQMMKKSEWTARWQILMEAIAKKENITVTDEDFAKLAEKEAPLIGLSVDKLIQYYKDSGRENVLLEDKVIEFLQDNNNIKEVTPEEYEKSNKLD